MVIVREDSTWSKPREVPVQIVAQLKQETPSPPFFFFFSAEGGSR